MRDHALRAGGDRRLVAARDLDRLGVATELLAGKTIAEAKSMSGEELAAPLGALPPVRIHCAQLVEGALRNALSDNKETSAPRTPATTSPTLMDQLSAGTGAKVKIVLQTAKAPSRSS